MLEHSSGFSRVRTLLQGAEGNGTSSACADTGEADVLSTFDPDPIVARLQGSKAVEIVAIDRKPARSGSFVAWPDHLDPRLVAALNGLGRDRAYTHQRAAIEASRRGDDVVVATSTASGKSLCYQVPILDATLGDPQARALLLFPTKALGRDQVEGLRQLSTAIGPAAAGVAVYDGDTPPAERRAARGRAHVVATNPDMLHRGILPHHERWAAFLRGVRYVVVDELHVYRGVFGSHVGHVLRRLWRVCRHYGATPQVIASSATIANPGPLCEALTGRANPTVIDADGAPAGARTTVVLNPTVVDPVVGVRRDYIKVTRHVTAQLQRAEIPTLVFCRTRRAVELLTRYLRHDEIARRGGQVDGPADRDAAASAVRGYRGGYLPGRRRAVEHALRSGEAKVVATTNALELGIDIGGVDAVVMSGYAGSRAATAQRGGRAGRRGRSALSIVVLSSRPLDQFIAASPAFLFDRAVEHARVDPLNPEILLPHLRCAIHELPVGPGDRYDGLTADDLLDAAEHLADTPGSAVRREHTPGGARYFLVGPRGPAEEVDLRGSIEEAFAVLGPGGDVLAEVAFEDGPLYLHPGAIYPVEGEVFEVRRLDWDARKAFVAPVAADYYTEAVSKTLVRMLDIRADASGSSCGPSHGTGYAHVIRQVPGFKKLRFRTHENIGFGPVDLPDLELHTTAAFWRFPDALARACPDLRTRAAQATAVAHAIHHVAALVLMCDVSDLGHAVTPLHPGAWGRATPTPAEAGALPCIVLYDNMPGGAGLSSQAHTLGPALLGRVIAVVEGCGCDHGCPTCLGPRGHDDEATVDRAGIVAYLRALADGITADCTADPTLGASP